MNLDKLLRQHLWSSSCCFLTSLVCPIANKVAITVPICYFFVHITNKAFFSPLKKKINWMIIALQCCIGFSHTTMWISQKYTYIPYLLNVLPSTPLRLTPLGCHRAWDWARWVIQQLPTDCLFHMFQCYSLSSSYSLLPSLCPQACSLGLHLQRCPADKLVITILSWFHICALIYIVSLFDLIHFV